MELIPVILTIITLIGLFAIVFGLALVFVLWVSDGGLLDCLSALLYGIEALVKFVRRKRRERRSR